MSAITAGSEGEREVVDHLRVIPTSVPLPELWFLVPLFLITIFLACSAWLFVDVRSKFRSVAERTRTDTEDSNPLPQVAIPLSNPGEGPTILSAVFSSSVLWWEPDILAWSQEYDLPPNLVALVMQLESCGDPQASSNAGAVGLFQVMPYHFTAEEDPFLPSTNAHRGMAYLSQSFELADGDIGRALAGYNGGHGVISNPPQSWANETQRYVRWGDGIWSEINRGSAVSPTLSAWLDAGGAHLCASALRWQADQQNGL